MKNRPVTEISRNQRVRRLIEYALFWSLSLIVLAQYFSFGDSIERIDWIYTLLFHISIGFGVSLNSLVLIPRLLATGRVLLYVIAVPVLIQLMIMLNQFTFNVMTDYLFPGYFFISYYEWYDLLYFMTAYLGITSLIQFSRSWFREAKTRNLLNEIKKSQTELELQALKAHVHPHFLFNGLNTIYGLIRKNPAKASEGVLLLAELLRYTVRQSGADLVPLSLEVDYLTRYVDFQKMRMDDASGIELKVTGSVDTVLIAPLMLIPFVENAFKYGENQITISLDCTSTEIIFQCRNRIRADVGSVDLEGNGTGLTNVRKRLGLLYENRHHLDIATDVEHFTVDLRLTHE